MLFLVAVFSVFFLGLGYILYVAYRRHRLQAQTWDQVLSRAERIDVEGIRVIAECYLHPDRHQLRIEPHEMWKLLGGLEGVNRLHKNARAILDLAVYAQRWDDTEGPVIAEMIRRDAVRVQGAVTRIQLTFVLGMGFVQAPFHVQEAAAAYFLMRSRLLGMYENCHVALVPQLAAAL